MVNASASLSLSPQVTPSVFILWPLTWETQEVLFMRRFLKALWLQLTESLKHVPTCAPFSPSSSSLMATHPSLPSTPSGPSTRTEMAPSTSESSSAHSPSLHGAVLSKSSTGPSTCTTWTETAKSHGWRCWRSSRYDVITRLLKRSRDLIVFTCTNDRWTASYLVCFRTCWVRAVGWACRIWDNYSSSQIFSS